jgi:thiamine transport system ATP-binding protein
MLAARDLTFRYEDWVGRYDLSVPRGALIALVGPSGGGKSTLLNGIAGFERPSSGTLIFEGRDLLPLKPAQRPVAIVFQEHNLLPNLTAAANAGLALSPSLHLKPSDHARIAEAMARVGLAGFEHRRPAELSGGQRQRVALARALLTTRPVLLLDEPLSGLDPALRRDMVALIDGLRREKNLAVVMTTHTPEDIEGIADGVLTVENGGIVRRGGG